MDIKKRTIKRVISTFHDLMNIARLLMSIFNGLIYSAVWPAYAAPPRAQCKEGPSFVEKQPFLKSFGCDPSRRVFAAQRVVVGLSLERRLASSLLENMDEYLSAIGPAAGVRRCPMVLREGVPGFYQDYYVGLR